MPAFANGGTTIVICSGVTGEIIEIQIDGEQSGDHETTPTKCSYSITGAYIDAPIPNLVKLDSAYVLANTVAGNALIAQSLLLSNYTRGPPHISLT